jgi:hypothetical protein
VRRPLLVHSFPRAWRERYGDELDQLIVELGGSRGARLRSSLDLVRAGVRERLRAAGLTGDQPAGPERVRAWLLLVLPAWALFVIAGVSVQKVSEHWQGATPASQRGLPADAFRALEILAAIASGLLLLGIAAALPQLVARARAGTIVELRRPLRRAVACTLATLLVATPVAIWAQSLTAAQRNGHDVAYELAVAACAFVAVCALAAWTAAAGAAARQTPLVGRLLELELVVGAAVTAAMAAMSVATIVWWVAVAGAAPGFVGDGLLVPRLLLPVLAMVLASMLGGAGTAGALRARSRLR